MFACKVAHPPPRTAQTGRSSCCRDATVRLAKPAIRRNCEIKGLANAQFADFVAVRFHPLSVRYADFGCPTF
jgi:hypothetical protein